MTPNWQFWMNWFAQMAIAVGTIAVVVAALFGDWLRAHLVPPKLVLKLNDERGVKTPVKLGVSNGTILETVGRWYHLSVSNDRRQWAPAKQVQVFLLRVEDPDIAGGYKITWLGEIPMMWPYQATTPLVRTIGYPVLCDLCSVV